MDQLGNVSDNRDMRSGDHAVRLTEAIGQSEAFLVFRERLSRAASAKPSAGPSTPS